MGTHAVSVYTSSLPLDLVHLNARPGAHLFRSTKIIGAFGLMREQNRQHRVLITLWNSAGTSA